MRLLTLGLLGLLLAAGPAQATAPAHQSARSAVPSKSVASKAPMARARAGAKVTGGPAQARLQQAAWRPGAAPDACSGRVRQCRSTAVARAPFGWTQGLPTAAGVQASECPDGTMATLARGHDDVVRCMPI